MILDNHKILIANRGEIAVRIIHTAKKLGIWTITVYTPADALSRHVILADESIPLPVNDPKAENASNQSTSEGTAYLVPDTFVRICKEHQVTLLHPGYGFLSENASFAQQVIDAGVIWLGPPPEIIRMMGLKHEARTIATEVGGDLAVVPGSEGLVKDVREAVHVVTKIGLPIILKASAGGGGLGMVVCKTEKEIQENFTSAKQRVRSLFEDDSLFMERYFPKARHIEIQVFGDGRGNVVHLSERECSAQRRHQKIIEESPSPFLENYLGLRERMCNAALALCRKINYESAGTVEFLVDNETGSFYFLEMNTRIQVEHPVTEVIYQDLDIIEMMINLGLSKKTGSGSWPDMRQTMYDDMRQLAMGMGRVHAIEGRVYAENAAESFLPSPGLLQYVQLEESKPKWLRIDHWISTGMQISPHFDPLLCKIIVYGNSREQAILRFVEAFGLCKIQGPPNNMDYLQMVAASQTFKEGKVVTKFLDGFEYIPRALKVITPGVEVSVQDLPGRIVGKGIPRSGPMDPLAFTIANLLVGNAVTVEGLEIVAVAGLSTCFQFLCSAVVSVAGKNVKINVNGVEYKTWSRLIIPAGAKLQIEAEISQSPGLRVYLAIRGGFPNIPMYLGSKSTSVCFGGYQGRPFMTGDMLFLGDCVPRTDDEPYTLPLALQPVYPPHWTIYVLQGPQDDEEFVTKDSISSFYETQWSVSSSCNRMGIRLASSENICWARETGGQGGAHPSNILDNGYAPGSININGDTPVILTNEGPDMGGYICMCTVASSELWKVGQLSPGCAVQFKPVSWKTALELKAGQKEIISVITKAIRNSGTSYPASTIPVQQLDPSTTISSPILYSKPNVTNSCERVVLRQAGDSAILVEFGIMKLDFIVRARIQVFMAKLKAKSIQGLGDLCPCIRSLMCHYDNSIISQDQAVRILVGTEQEISSDTNKLTFAGRRITFPIVLDDPWCKKATERYMQAIRSKAVYLPNNIDYLAKNNGLNGRVEALEKLMSSDWIILGVGFYLACPFLVPVDPRSVLVAQKLNPSRTFTPRGAVGIAGPVAAIYPIESPGGYQLFGRTLPAWQTWSKGANFSPDSPWLLETFDQIRFEQISEREYVELEKLFDQGRYVFKIETVTFSMEQYSEFLQSSHDETVTFRKQQETANLQESKRERELLLEWEQEKAKTQTQQGLNGTDDGQDDYSDSDNNCVKACLFASVWKICCEVGDRITSLDESLFILEAMKTEIPVRPRPEHLGKTIQQFGPGIGEQAHVEPGKVLIYLA